MIDYTEPKKKRAHFSVSPESIELLKNNIKQNRRSMFVDFLITKYCEHEAGYFNNLVFSKHTAEILARRNKQQETEEKSELPELIAELNKHIDGLAEFQKLRKSELEKIEIDENRM